MSIIGVPRNCNMREVFLQDLSIFIILCKGEEKCKENWAIFKSKYGTAQL